jgi:hypothetical protein
MTLNEDVCRALATMSRLDVKVKINKCRLSTDAAGAAFVECAQSDKGPIELDNCLNHTQILASALAGKSRVTRLYLNHKIEPATDTADVVLFRALANTRGLLDLDFDSYPISSENWSVLCESLQAHPTLLQGQGTVLVV